MKLLLWKLLIIYLIAIGFLSFMFYMGIQYEKTQIIKEAFSKMPISEAQKDLIDFADKQRELYRKTHQ
jgi:hypothetical protein